MYSCRPGQGSDMSLEIFKKAVDITGIYNNRFTRIGIGGGEPTLHPDFITMLNYAILKRFSHICIVTNGTCDEKTWNTLVDIKQRNDTRMILNVTDDPWHDETMIKEWVKDDADRLGLWFREGKNEYCVIVALGRAKKNIDKLVSDVESCGYRGIITRNHINSIHINPEGWVYVYTNEMEKIGFLSEETVDKAFMMSRGV
jgi:MoaA/NifB/PqqE/SkfB family radical SAM enzyme